MSTSPPPAPPSPDGLLDGVADVAEVVSLEDADALIGDVEPAAARRLAVSVLSMLVCVALTYALPSLEWARPWTAEEDYVPFWNLVGRELMDQGARAQEQEQAQRELEALARAVVEDPPAPTPRVNTAPEETLDLAQDQYPALTKTDGVQAPPTVGLEGATALEPFFEQLSLLDLGRRSTPLRVSHWGDSVLGNDGITSAIRDRLQARFGDAGHGFHLLAQNNPSYRHKGVGVTYKSPWRSCYVINKCKADQRYGFGGLTVWSAGGGETRFRFGEEVGATLAGARAGEDRFEVWYATGPKGGDLRVKMDREELGVISTRAPQPGEARAVFTVPAGRHEYGVRAIGGGVARAFGVVLEHERPGIVWDGIALIGAFTSRFSPKYFDVEHFHSQFRSRGTELAVLMFGGNDLNGFSAERYEATMESMIGMVRSADPASACLVISIVDHGERKGARIVSRPQVASMVALQRGVALKGGCGYFNAYEAMGGEGSMGRWNRSSPRLGSGDLAHLTHHGHQVLGELFTKALLAAYADFRDERVGAALPVPPAVREETPAGHREDPSSATRRDSDPGERVPRTGR